MNTACCGKAGTGQQVSVDLDWKTATQTLPCFPLDIFLSQNIIEYISKKERTHMFYRMKVAGLERDLPICPVNENLYIAGFVIFGDQELTVACARDLLERAPEYD